MERAILEDDAETGVCLMAVEAGLDTGGIYAEVATAIDEEETAEDLRARLVGLGCRLLEQNLAHGKAGLPLPRDQVGTPSYAEKILSAERELHWDQPGAQLRRVVRVGRAWTTFRHHRLGVVSASRAPDDGPTSPGAPGALAGTDVWAGDGTRVRLVTVHPEGKRPMAADEWIRGVRPGPDEGLGPWPSSGHR